MHCHYSAPDPIMPRMNDSTLTKIEHKLEKFIEGAFSALFRQRVQARELSVHLIRAMEDNLCEDDTRPRGQRIAPDLYKIFLEGRTRQSLLEQAPDLVDRLIELVVEIARLSDYRLLNPPQVILEVAVAPVEKRVMIQAEHQTPARARTESMEPIRKASVQRPPNPHLVIGTNRTEWLQGSIINIGRSAHNHIRIHDPYISRHHLQIRLRGNVYTLFDVESRGGTRVNGTSVVEHNLQSGDVIAIGETRLVYLCDVASDDDAPPTTQSLQPIN